MQELEIIPSARKRPSSFEDTLAGISSSLEQTLFAEQIGARAGFFQRLDPRIKILATLMFLTAVSLSRNLLVVIGIYFGGLLFAWVSAVPMVFFIKRVWLLMPFFTAVVALPAIFITPGPALLTLPLGITLTQTGLMAALFLLMRVGTSVSLTILLVLTTPWNTLLKALRVLHLPDVFLLILGMTYRYIYLFLHLTNEMFLSRKSRMVGQPTPKVQRQMVAASAGVLLSKSLQMSSEVYLAMQSRGFRGVPRTADTFQLKPLDYWFAGFSLLLAGSAIWLGR